MLFLLYYLVFIFLIVIIAGALPFLFQSFPYFDAERVSAYECGFEPFGDARDTFDVHFYLVGLIFIVFDIEIVFLVPWVLIYNNDVTLFELFVVLCVIFIAGFVFEYRARVLDWNKLVIQK